MVQQCCSVGFCELWVEKTAVCNSAAADSFFGEARTKAVPILLDMSLGTMENMDKLTKAFDPLPSRRGLHSPIIALMAMSAPGKMAGI